MKRVHTAKQISCPECDETSQSMDAKGAKEIIVPYLETVLLRRQERLRGGGSSKLNPSDVRKIREMWAKAIYKDKQEKIYIAEQFNVKERAVDNILTGKAWSFVP